MDALDHIDVAGRAVRAEADDVGRPYSSQTARSGPSEGQGCWQPSHRTDDNLVDSRVCPLSEIRTDENNLAPLPREVVKEVPSDSLDAPPLMGAWEDDNDFRWGGHVVIVMTDRRDGR